MTIYFYVIVLVLTILIGLIAAYLSIPLAATLTAILVAIGILYIIYPCADCLGGDSDDYKKTRLQACFIATMFGVTVGITFYLFASILRS